MPLYDCGDPDCFECNMAFGPSRSKAIEAAAARDALVKCDGCGVMFDGADGSDAEGQWFCDACQEAHMAEGLRLAAEYDRERDQAGADWRGENWLGPALKRDRLEDCIDRADMERKRLREEGK